MAKKAKKEKVEVDPAFEEERYRVLSKALGAKAAQKGLAIEKKHGFKTWFMWPYQGFREEMGK